VAQIERHRGADDFSASSLDAVFFGGGTASLMSERAVAAIMEALAHCSVLNSAIEVTLECEPGTINRRRLERMRALGVNRVSVCAQAFDNEQLRRIGRKHTSEDALALVEYCNQVGISNIHVDLIYGLPGQTLASWERTLLKATSLPITHASAYKLYVYRHGLLHREHSVPRPEAEADSTTATLKAMHDTALHLFEEAGFRQYSLTDYARPRFESVYIRGCFEGKDLLPIGPSAFGRCGNEVWDVSPYVHLYGNESVGSSFDRAFHMSPQEAFKRDALLGLWLLSVSVEELAERYRVAPEISLLDLLNNSRLLDEIGFERNQVFLAKRHRFWIGNVMARLSQLDANLWAKSQSAVQEQPKHTLSEISVPKRGLELNFIFRMARRDPAFFEALNSAPLPTLQRLDTGLSEPDICDLAAAIEGRAGATQDLRSLWMAVVREHGQG
jgi:oxygen-independent coproporphyrinogen-3 oxidase